MSNTEDRVTSTAGDIRRQAVDKVDVTLDCRGLLCPMPALKTSTALKNLQVGQLLEVLATDPGAKPDMLAWSKRTGYELVRMEEESGVLKFYIRKTA
jgi:tRNA 2-thiouridine synthesizing protein A